MPFNVFVSETNPIPQADPALRPLTWGSFICSPAGIFLDDLTVVERVAVNFIPITGDAYLELRNDTAYDWNELYVTTDFDLLWEVLNLFKNGIYVEWDHVLNKPIVINNVVAGTAVVGVDPISVDFANDVYTVSFTGDYYTKVEVNNLYVGDDTYITVLDGEGDRIGKKVITWMGGGGPQGCDCDVDISLSDEWKHPFRRHPLNNKPYYCRYLQIRGGMYDTREVLHGLSSYEFVVVSLEESLLRHDDATVAAPFNYHWLDASIRTSVSPLDTIRLTYSEDLRDFTLYVLLLYTKPGDGHLTVPGNPSSEEGCVWEVSLTDEWKHPYRRYPLTNEPYYCRYVQLTGGMYNTEEIQHLITGYKFLTVSVEESLLIDGNGAISAPFNYHWLDASVLSKVNAFDTVRLTYSEDLRPFTIYLLLLYVKENE